MKRVFLIDSMAYIYQAFFAPVSGGKDPLRTTQGQLTQAAFVFVTMLRKLIQYEKPEYIAAIFDTDVPTFRHEMYDGYKANRSEKPHDLVTQLPYIIRICEAFRVPVIRYDGVEADDIIGTLAHQVKRDGMKAIIVSNDKDLCQLVSDPHIVAMRTNSGNIRRNVPVPPIEWCDEKWVKNKFGLPPNKIVDMLALMGDSADNIPGAAGVGDKGAVKLILEYGSTRNALLRAKEIAHRGYRNSLQQNHEMIRLSLELATINCEVPLNLDLQSLRYTQPDMKMAHELFRHLEFTSLTREFRPR